jgi:hypothetical protein
VWFSGETRGLPDFRAIDLIAYAGVEALCAAFGGVLLRGEGCDKLEAP